MNHGIKSIDGIKVPGARKAREPKPGKWEFRPWAKWFMASVLLGSLTIQADPFKTWSWQSPATYENGQAIPAGDLFNYTMHCSNNPGPPYEASKVFESQTPPSLDDMNFIVAGVAGTYYCVSTVDSLTHITTSGYSNEVNFSVQPGELGYVPNALILSLE